MRSISMYDSNSISTLFSSLNTGRGNRNSGMLNMNIDLSTYSMIKSGSYNKLMRSYYETEDPKKLNPLSTSTAKDSTKTLSNIQGAAEDVKKSAEALYKSKDKLFEADSEGKYRTDDIYKAVDKFVSDYNDLIKAAGKSETKSIAGDGAGLVNYVKNNVKTLSKLGISFSSSDYTLSIDEKAFKKADMTTAKSMFSGAGSFAYSVAVKASMIKSHADLELSKSNTYNHSGNFTYNYSTGELFNSNI